MNKYCEDCRESGAARKDIVKKYNHSKKGGIVQKRYRGTIARRISANKYNRSEQGKEDTMKQTRP